MFIELLARFLGIASFLILAGLSWPDDVEAETSADFSAVLVPAVGDGSGPGVAIHWNGPTPVELRVVGRGERSESSPDCCSFAIDREMTVIRAAEVSNSEQLALFGPNGERLATTSVGSESYGWQSDFVGMGVEGDVEAVLEFNGDLIVAGRDNLSAGRVAGAALVAWNGSQWRRLGDEAFGGAAGVFIYALAVFQGQLVAAGNFTQIGERPVLRIARWDGSQWLPLGNEESNGVGPTKPNAESVRSLALYGGELVVGGHFANADDVVVSNVARWDGVRWAALGSGIVGSGFWPTVHVLESFNGELIVAGSFGVAGGVEVDGLARWNGSFWQDLRRDDGGPYGGWAITDMTTFGQAVYMAPDAFSEHVIVWDGTELTNQNDISCQGFVSCTVEIDQLHVSGNELYGVGSFSRRSFIPDTFERASVARWTGSQWTHVRDGDDNPLERWATAAGTYQGQLLVAGAFEAVGDQRLDGLALFDGQTWRPLPNHRGHGISDGPVNAATVWNGELVIGGQFRWAGSTLANGLARWNGFEWRAFEGLEDVGVGSGEVLALRAHGPDLFVAGRFNQAGGLVSPNIARFGPAGWSSIDTGYAQPGTIRSLGVWQDQIIAGLGDGDGDDDVEVAAFNGVSWASLGNGGSPAVFDGRINSFEVFGGDLYAAGSFYTVDGQSMRSIARYDGVTWQPLSTHQPRGPVHDLKVFDGTLWVGGRFWGVGELDIDHLARWTGDDWAALGNESGITSSRRLDRVSWIDTWRGQLIVSGEFDPPSGSGPVWQRELARYTTERWAFFLGPIPDTWDPEVRDVVHWKGHDLFVGDFSQAGGLMAQGIAEFVPEPASIVIDRAELNTSYSNSATVTVTANGLISELTSGFVVVSSDQGESCSSVWSIPAGDLGRQFECRIDLNDGGVRQLTARLKGSNTHADATSSPVSFTARWPTQVEIVETIPAAEQTIGQPFDVVIDVAGPDNPTGQVRVRDDHNQTLCVITLPNDRCTAVYWEEEIIELRARYEGDFLHQPGMATQSMAFVLGDLGFSPQRLEFGELAIGQISTPRLMSVRNVSGSALMINAIGRPGSPFEEMPFGSCRPLPVTLMPGEACTLIYRLTPDSVNEAASFMIHSTASDGPHVIFLSGSGVDAIFKDAFRW